MKASRRSRIPVFLQAALTALFASGSALAGEAVDVRIDPARPGAQISRHVFGQFAEHLGHGIYEGVWVGPESPIPNTRGIRNDVVAALREIKVPNVRWPGGCFADEYHWRNGIGPAQARRATVNNNWGGVVEPNTFGTAEFMDFVGQLGADAYVSANVGSGTVQEASEWLEYMTAGKDSAMGRERVEHGRAEPYKVAFWGIGNESWGCGGSMTGEYYVSLMKQFARFNVNYNKQQPMMKFAVGPDGNKTEYTEAVMKAWSERNWSWSIDGISLHSYTVKGWPPSVKATGFGDREYAEFLKETLGMENMLRTHEAIMDRYDPEKKVALVVDEWGSWLAPTPGTNPGFLMQQNSMRDAVLAALNLNIFARHADRVRMTNIAQMVNVLQAMLLTEGPKLLRTPTYYVYQLYLPFHDATSIPVAYDAGVYRQGDVSLPRLDAIAARDAAGKLWLAITNIDPHAPAELRLSVAGLKAGPVHGQTLTAPAVDSINTFEQPRTVAPRAISGSVKQGHIVLTVPARSVTVVPLSR